MDKKSGKPSRKRQQPRQFRRKKKRPPPQLQHLYLQAKPGDAPFVTVGSHVKKGQVVCIVEAMKMMTEIKSTVSGTVSQVLVENEDLVECDQTLFTVKED